MHDRLGLITGRMAMQTAGQKPEGVDALRDLRVGRNVIRLRRAHAMALPQAEGPLNALLAQTADFYRASAARRAPLAPPPGLLAAIDEALPAMRHVPAGETRRHGLLALAGLRRNLFPDAPAYQGQAA